MAAKRSIILITGANSGIGFSLASQLLADPSKHILLGSRSADKGAAALKDLESQNLPGRVELLQVDVSNEDSIAAAARKVEADHGRLDALVNNAGVAMVEGSTAQQLTTAFTTNAIGPLLMVNHFTPLLEKAASGTPRIVNVSSSQGSVTRRLDPSVFGYNVKGVHYRTSKAALNMVTACQEVELAGRGFKVFAYCPGYTVSNLSGGNRAANGAQPTSEGAAPIVDLLNGERDAEHGKFVHGAGQYPW